MKYYLLVAILTSALSCKHANSSQADIYTNDSNQDAKWIDAGTKLKVAMKSIYSEFDYEFEVIRSGMVDNTFRILLSIRTPQNALTCNYNAYYVDPSATHHTLGVPSYEEVKEKIALAKALLESEQNDPKEKPSTDWAGTDDLLNSYKNTLSKVSPPELRQATDPFYYFETTQIECNGAGFDYSSVKYHSHTLGGLSSWSKDFWPFLFIMGTYYED